MKCDASNCESFMNDIYSDNCQFADRATGKICQHGNPNIKPIPKASEKRFTPEQKEALEVSIKTMEYKSNTRVMNREFIPVILMNIEPNSKNQ